MKLPLVALAAASILLSSLPGAAAPSRMASVAVVWRIPAPAADDASVQQVEAGVIALNFIAPQLNALSRHPGAKVSLALDPAFVDALTRMGSGNSALTKTAAGQIAAQDARATQLLDVLSSDVVPPTSVATTAAAKRFSSDATAARLALMGDNAARFSQSDEVDFAAAAIAMSLAASGYARGDAGLLKKNNLSGRDLQTVAASLARGSRDVLERLKQAAARGSIEIAAMPAYEPIMPLVINAAGRTSKTPYTVNLGAAADVGYAVDAGLRAVRALTPGEAQPGIFAPSGAYDDETAMLLQARDAAYGIFSERVVKANAGASATSVSDIHAAAFRAYLLETGKTTKLPVLFCSDTTSAALDSLPPSAPSTAVADRLKAAVSSAISLSAPASPTLVVVCLDGSGGVLRRADRVDVIDHLVAMLTSNPAVTGTTPKEFLRRHPPSAETYGYAPGSDAGGFDLWMGSANQMSMWTALADARKAVGGDAGLANAGVREALLRAESGLWFLSLAIPQPRYLTDRSLLRFRAAIAGVYLAAGKSAPPNIAPVKLEAPAPVGASGR